MSKSEERRMSHMEREEYVKKLEAEVEKLHDEHEQLKICWHGEAEWHVERYDKLQSQLEAAQDDIAKRKEESGEDLSLTELDAELLANGIDMRKAHKNLMVILELKQQLEAVTKEQDGLKEEIRISQGIKDGSYTAPSDGWTCYHCGVTFRKPGAASDHFGEVPRDKSKCQYHDLDVEKLEAALAASEKRVEELEQRISNLHVNQSSADANKQILEIKRFTGGFYDDSKCDPA